MSMILAIFDLKGSPKLKEEFKGAINDFSLDGRRQLTGYESGNFIIYSACRIFPCEQVRTFPDGITVAISGRIYGIRKGHGSTDAIDPAAYIRDLYLMNDPSKLSNIDGSFSFILFDPKNKKLTAGNDAFGLYKLYYTRCGGRIIFCNEFEPLTKTGSIDFTVNYDAVLEYFVLGGILWDKTIYNEINPLQPGSYLTFSVKKTGLKHYNRIPVSINKGLDPGKAASEMAVLIKNAVSKRLVMPLGNNSIDLSGGIDTRLIISCIENKKRAELTYRTYLTPPLDESNDQDVIIAKMIAEKLGLKLHIEKFSDWDEEFNPSYFKKWRALSYGDHHMKGLFGGEFLNGDCLRFIPAGTVEFIRQAKFAGRQLFPFFKNTRSKFPRLSPIFKTDGLKNPYQSLYNLLSGFETENKLLLFAFFTFAGAFFSRYYGGSRAIWAQPATFLTKVDTPFLDNELLSYLLTLPDHFLKGEKEHLIYNLLFRDHFSELNDIPSISSLADVQGNCLIPFREGREPKSERQPRYNEAYRKLQEKFPLWADQVLHREIASAILKNQESGLTMAIIDLDAFLYQ